MEFITENKLNRNVDIRTGSLITHGKAIPLSGIAFQSRSGKTPCNFPLCRFLTSHWKRGRWISSLRLHYVCQAKEFHVLKILQNTTLSQSSLTVMSPLVSLMCFKIKTGIMILTHLMSILSNPPEYTHSSTYPIQERKLSYLRACLYLFYLFIDLHIFSMSIIFKCKSYSSEQELCYMPHCSPNTRKILITQ